MTQSQTTIAEILRGRLLRGVEAHTLTPGDRLPSARELVAEFKVDNRLILAAYRQLADEGLIEIRERGGVYVSANLAMGSSAASWPAKWFTDLFTEALGRGIPGPALSENLGRTLDTLRLRAVVISTSEDQVVGLTRELRDDFGLLADGFTAAALSEQRARKEVLKRADLFVGTEGQAGIVQGLAAEHSRPSMIIKVKSDFVAGEWAMLLRQPVWAIVATRQFGDMLCRFLSDQRGIENLHVIVYGEDDLGQIPSGTPIYVTHRVREQLDLTTLPGRILPPARTISSESARDIFSFIIRSNVQALQALKASRDTER